MLSGCSLQQHLHHHFGLPAPPDFEVGNKLRLAHNVKMVISQPWCIQTPWDFLQNVPVI